MSSNHQHLEPEYVFLPTGKDGGGGALGFVSRKRSASSHCSSVKSASSRTIRKPNAWLNSHDTLKLRTYSSMTSCSYTSLCLHMQRVSNLNFSKGTNVRVRSFWEIDQLFRLSYYIHRCIYRAFNCVLPSRDQWHTYHDIGYPA